MQRFFFAVTVFVAASLIAGCQSGPTPTPTEAATLQPTSAPTFTRTPPPTWTPTPEPTQLPTETPTPAPTATPVPEEVWVNSAAGLNLRAEPSTTAKSVAALKQRQHLVVIGPANGPDANGLTWQNVRTDEGQVGWASAQFLTKTNPAGGTPVPIAAAATPAPTQAPATVAPPSAASGEAWVNSANGLNLRAQAVSTSTVIVVLPFGAHVALTAAPQGPDAGGITWQNVRADDGKTGFVAAQFLSAAKPVTTTTPVTSTVPSATAPTTSTVPATATPVPTTTGSTGNVYVIATNGLNLRSQPNITAGAVATLVYGQRLTALAPKGTPDAGGVTWQNVRTDANQSGWAAADYLSATSPVTTTTGPTGTLATTNTVTVNVTNDLLQRINDLRSQNNVTGVKLNTPLGTAAQRHSQDMAKTGNVSHTGSDGTQPAQRIGAAGYGGSQRDEIIYGGSASLNDPWFFWTNDRRSANMILNPIYTEVGIAAVTAGNQTYYTVTFGGP